ncbi:MAG: toxin [Candidatus Hydrogenedens sp.]|nr:toxin [Candidatus Hydrogenedens sp.]
MKRLDWNSDKNEWLRRTRGISFDEIALLLQSGQLLAILDRGAPDRYPGQYVFVINVDGYAYIVPYVEDEHSYFLKTIIPSRKMTRRYLGMDKHETD